MPKGGTWAGYDLRLHPSIWELACWVWLKMISVAVLGPYYPLYLPHLGMHLCIPTVPIRYEYCKFNQYTRLYPWFTQDPSKQNEWGCKENAKKIHFVNAWQLCGRILIIFMYYWMSCVYWLNWQYSYLIGTMGIQRCIPKCGKCGG